MVTTVNVSPPTDTRQYLLDTYQALLGEVMRGGGLEVIAEQMAERLQRPLIIVDTRLVTVASHFPARDPGLAARGVNLFAELERLEPHETIKRLKLERRVRQIELPVGENGEAGPALITPIFVEEQLCGYVIAVGLSGEEDAYESQMLSCAAIVAAVEMRRLKTKITTEQKLGKVFLKELLGADPSKANELYRKARYLGYTLAEGYMMIVVAPDDAQPDAGMVAKFQQRLVKECYRATAGGGLIHQQGEQFILFHPISSSSSPSEAKRFGEQVVQLGQVSQLKVSVGVGGLHLGLSGIAKSFQEAQQALRVSRLWGNGRLTYYDELETYQLLLQSTEQLDLSKVSLGALDTLVEYDRRTNSELTKTLEVYLQCNGNITKATKALHIHRNTMKYRLEKIVDLSNIDLDDAEQRFELQLNLKINKMRQAVQPLHA
ncbi:MAG: helix-turn-helix domain-containing protein [Candidatus Sericytochromatia bacterium]|nr:helix-turn-helix domain-containing protein [Candidatus Sericytochromatia bacterium]